ncbi:Glutamate decarboxylase 2 [Tilletia horrida]|nr:Glutamate decarboxylase 2 [Tilletia horrida]
MPSPVANVMQAPAGGSKLRAGQDVSRPVASQQAAVLLPEITALALDWMKRGESGGAVVEDHSPDELQELLSISFPEDGGKNASASGSSNDVSTDAGLRRVVAASEKILRYSVNHWTQGRFAAKLYSSIDPVGQASELLLGTLNANAHVFSAAPALSVIEVATVRKINDLIQYGPDAGGLTMPGGSASNRLSLTTAINNLLPSVQKEGIASLPQPPVIFTSEHSHYSIEQAAISAGIGLNNVIKVATDDAGRMNVDDLARQLESSVANGKQPFYINATSGTTVTGCFDNIRQVSAVARKYDCWLHVDGSWGGSVMFSSKYRSLLDGIELSDSFTVNPHKGLRVPLQCSFLLVRDRRWLGANVVEGDYLFHEGQQYDIGRTTTFCGRRSDALKLYLAWQMHGSQGLARMIDDALDSGKVIRQRIREHPNLQLILPQDEHTPSYSVCFRFRRSRDTASAPADCAALTLTPRQMVRPIHAAVLRRGRVMVDFAPLRVRVRDRVVATAGGSDEAGPSAAQDANELGFVGDVFRLPLHPFGLAAGLLVLEEIVEVGTELYGP